MTTKQLEALLIDQALGELSEDASALLEAWLSRFPERRAEAEQIRIAVGLAEAAVVSRPLTLQPNEPLAFPSTARLLPTLLRLAAAVALLGLAAGTGFLAGRGSAPSASRPETIAGPPPQFTPSPWARYRVGENGSLAVILPADPNS
jgi:anti-sigma factor RsiW